MMVDDKTIKSPTALKEEQTLAFWREIDAFKKTVEKEAPKGEYVFFDGPPFATGTPHYGHLLASTIKDAIPRYKTMKGYKVLRRWGWDCHGLPIENIVEKDLGISGRKQIEELGLEKFNEHARSKVMTYAHEWKRTIERLARWVEFDNSYKTMDNTYIESVWWALKNFYNEGKVYESVKVLMYCPRCETPLSNAEVAMDNSYKDITDISVYVKFKLLGEENTYVIAWTTTPWTLPGNVALAVNKTQTYLKLKLVKDDSKEFPLKEGESIIIMQSAELQAKLFDSHLNINLENNEASVNFKNKGNVLFGFEVLTGEQLVGKLYEPVFSYYAQKNLKNRENGWKIYAGDFVTTTDGTGVVHIAPAFGEDDLRLAKENNLPIIHHVDGAGKFKSEVIDFAERLVKPKDTKEEPQKHQSADIEIIKYLAHNGKLFAKEKIIHSYPHCYRCETPLYYYAIPAWFLEIQSSKEKFIKLNEKINWIPSHLKDGRFKHVMENAPDWNISRNRVWATPLPFWKCSMCQSVDVVGSSGELKEKAKKGIVAFTLMRHGESEKNIKGIFDDSVEKCPLTEKGKEQVKNEIENLKAKKIDVIYCSPVMRAKETAEIIAKELNVSIFVENDLKEIDSGEWDGKTIKDVSETTGRSEYNGLSIDEYYSAKRGKTGESWKETEIRIHKVVEKISRENDGKNILIVSHQGPLIYLLRALKNLDLEQTGDLFNKYNTFDYAKHVSIYVDTNRIKEFDSHRPYIDNFTWSCSCGGEYKRISEVIDCWFESASMPYASQHYPFENKEFFKSHFPADFITEYIAQTRTWFYYTHAISTMLFGDIAFKNVVTTGTVLAEDGQKMSKSKNNFPDPWIMFDKYGADAVRFYLLSSPLLRSEDLNFAEREVDEIHKKIILRMRNILSFYEMYKREDVEMKNDSRNVLDRWIITRLSQVHSEVVKGIEGYELDKALKSIPLFVDDLSTWYLRRSRDRMKNTDTDSIAALSTLRFVIFSFSQIVAPFMPFIAEDLYQGVKTDTDEKSVHLTSWPERIESIGSRIKHMIVKNTVISDMEKVREIVSLGLEARGAVGIKVKQPLSMLAVNDPENLFSDEQYAALVRDEVNVKTVVSESHRDVPVWLDVNITPELKEEGGYREFLRAVQDTRKQKGLVPKDTPTLIVSCTETEKEFLEKFKSELMRAASLSGIEYAELEGEEIVIGDKKMIISFRM